MLLRKPHRVRTGGGDPHGEGFTPRRPRGGSRGYTSRGMPPVVPMRPDAMVDPYGRAVRYLRISVTDRCNLRCFYCMPDGLASKYERDEVLSLEEIVRLAGAFVRLGVEKVRITGGEPLYRRGMPELVARLKALDGLREVCMTTNGLALASQDAA